jgi:hypothetical protein
MIEQGGDGTRGRAAAYKGAIKSDTKWFEYIHKIKGHCRRRRRRPKGRMEKEDKN